MPVIRRQAEQAVVKHRPGAKLLGHHLALEASHISHNEQCKQRRYQPQPAGRLRIQCRARAKHDGAGINRVAAQAVGAGSHKMLWRKRIHRQAAAAVPQVVHRPQD